MTPFFCSYLFLLFLCLSVLADDVEETEEAGEYGAEEEEDAYMQDDKDLVGEGGVKSEIMMEDGTKFKAESGVAAASSEPKHAGDVKPGHAVPNHLRATTSYMTKYERARILGQKNTQI